MISELQLQNFKCFQELKTFKFSKVNLLTGINGRGKSTLLQSILILSQSAWKNPELKKLVINDELLKLGNFDDIKNSETPRGESMYFHLKLDSPFVQEAKLQFREDPDEPLIAQYFKLEFNTRNTNVVIEQRAKTVDEIVFTFSEIIKRVHFVSADRLGPVKYVDKTNMPEFVHVGPRGEHTINILSNSINLPNVDERLYRGVDSKSIIQQTTEWLGYILEGAKIEIGGKERESSVLYMLLNNKPNSYSYKQSNVGFGYSYILPIIVTGLVAKPGDIVIVENPEAHLHPAAQSKIAEFLSIVSSCGVQVFIESHSEHILNGLRVSALRPDVAISNDDLFIHYFDKSFDSERLLIDSKGKIENWPIGFFDQQEQDLSTIFKLSR